ncbi:MAG: fimbrillin family protein [Alistipes sp.]|nr:fimbrillin family protein [Alistipes sp.]
MKKLFVSVLAIASMVACMNEETVRLQDPAAIGFEANWVENATRANAALDPSTTTESLTGFKVWGFMDSVDGKVFEGEEVTGSKGNFTYNNIAYWLPDHTYYFAALAPIGGNWTLNTEAANYYGAGIVNFLNANGTEDLLYAANVESAPALGEAKTVNFTFSHLLSKVKFTFTNGFTNENMYIDVKNVRIVNAPMAGSINLAVENWWDNDDWKLTNDTVELAFGDACAKTAMGETQVAANERLTIPASAEYKYEVKFDVALYMGDVLAYEGTKTSYVQGVALEMGKAYNFSATLNASNFTEEGKELMPIVFDVVEVKEWVEAGEQTTVLPSNISGLTLVADAVAKNTLNLKGSFDGAGHTLTAEAVEVKGGAARLIDATADSQIRNLNIDGANLVIKGDKDYGIRALFLNGAGDFVIDNVTIKNVTYTINDDSAAKTIKVINSTLEGWTSYNPATVATFENVEFKCGPSQKTFRPHGTTTLKNCNFEEGFVIRLDKLAEGKTIKFENCTYAGRALTSADLTSAPAGAVEVKVAVTEAPESNAIVTGSASNMTIDGGNYTTTDGKGLRAIYLNGVEGEFTFDNMVIKNVAYAINVNSTKAVTLKVSNSTLEGWTSYGNSTTATFDTVNFTCGNYYANNKVYSSNDNGLFRPYGATVCKNCTFEAGFYIDLGSLTGTLTLDNCSYNGVVLTEENVASVACFDNFDASKLVF